MARQKTSQDEINLADSVCDPNGRWVTTFSCSTATTSNYGCMTVDNYQVPQVGQFLIAGSWISGSGPTIINGISYPHQPVFQLILAVQPQNPSIVGNHDADTINLPGATACGYECSNNSCYWTGLPTATHTTWNDCATAVSAGACASIPPTHYCSDYNVFEIIYPRVTYTGSTGKDEATVLSEIISRTTGGLYPYSDPGGVWNGFSLTQMASTAGTSAIGGTSIYNPLKGSLDDCIACCGGVNQQFDSSGAVNPHYGMTNHPTPHAGYAAYLAVNSLTQSSGTFIDYMLSIGVDSCGLTANNAGIRI